MKLRPNQKFGEDTVGVFPGQVFNEPGPPDAALTLSAFWMKPWACKVEIRWMDEGKFFGRMQLEGGPHLIDMAAEAKVCSF